MPPLRLFSPAKINLYLRVLRQRPDGFHDIETLFQRISLKDEIILTPRSDGKIEIVCDCPEVPTDERNIAHKAARILQREFAPQDRGVRIEIRKRIPVAAGLAGGSTNAATALMGLNRLWRLKLTVKQLAEVARRIGSDVPYFLYDAGLAVGTGRGDRIRPLKTGPECHYVLVVPRVKLLAGRVYGGLKTKLTKKMGNVNILTYHLRKKDLESVGSLILNDLEPVVLRLCPRIARLKERLKALKAKGVMVSGSGPSVFGLMASEQDARIAAEALSKRYRRVFVVKSG